MRLSWNGGKCSLKHKSIHDIICKRMSGKNNSIQMFEDRQIRTAKISGKER